MVIIYKTLCNFQNSFFLESFCEISYQLPLFPNDIEGILLLLFQLHKRKLWKFVVSNGYGPVQMSGNALR